MYIDITGIEELYSVGIGDPLVIGANVNLNRCISVFEEAATNYSGHKHLREIAKHWGEVANVGVRNVSYMTDFLFFFVLKRYMFGHF